MHEIKHVRMMVHRDPASVRFLTRNGHDWTGRFPLIAQAAGALKVRSFLLDGEAVVLAGFNP
jgi:bifunctional non-homologous end joining protein LigD